MIGLSFSLVASRVGLSQWVVAIGLVPSFGMRLVSVVFLVHGWFVMTIRCTIGFPSLDCSWLGCFHYSLHGSLFQWPARVWAVATWFGPLTGLLVVGLLSFMMLHSVGYFHGSAVAPSLTRSPFSSVDGFFRYPEYGFPLLGILFDWSHLVLSCGLF